MNNKWKISKILDFLVKNDYYFILADDYAEPGYSLDSSDGFIVFANWNPSNLRNRWETKTAKRRIKNYWANSPEIEKEEFRDYTMSIAGDLLEKLGCSIEWEDEWTTCECGKAVRTSPDSYGWTPYYVVYDDCEVVCGDCIKEDISEYLEHCQNDPDKAILPQFNINLAEHGYEQYNGEFETGLHTGQDDDPHKIALILKEEGVNDFLFSIDDVGQFDCMWTTWIKK